MPPVGHWHDARKLWVCGRRRKEITGVSSQEKNLPLLVPHSPTCRSLASSQWPIGGPKNGQLLSYISPCPWCLFSPISWLWHAPLQSLAHLLTLFSPDCHPLSIGLSKISPGLMDSYISSWLSHAAYSAPWWCRQCTHLKCRSTFMRPHSTASQKAVTFNSKKLWWIWFVSSHVENLLVTALQIRLYSAKLTKQVSHK